MENETDRTMMAFDMGALRTNLPQNRRGLSRYYSGKARSFTCMADVHSVEDLKKKQHHPDAKKRKKQQSDMQVPPFPCRRISSSTHCASPIVGI